MAETVASVRVRAPGKVNIYLACGELQEDGYHELATAFQALSLYEEVIATPSHEFTLTVSGDVAVSGVPTDDTNLALQAARLLAARTGVNQGVHLDIYKGVPVAGGMGGGSADAAAALVACDALWGTRLTTAELHELAAELGADVPFALHGGTAIGAGKGDRLSQALVKGRFDWVLVTSEQGISTPAAYGTLDDQRAAQRAERPIVPAQPQVDAEILHALRSGDAPRLARAAHNDLQAAAFALRPELEHVLADGIAAGALGGLVSGSGPTIALLCENAEAAAIVAEAMTRSGHTAIHAHGPVPGARILV